MRLSVGLLVVALSSSFNAFALADPGRGRFHVKEAVHVPREWVEHAKPAPDHTIVLRIGLPQPNFPVLEKHLYEVSDPEHDRYGDHLSKEEVEDLVRPHPDSLEAVNKWLVSHGFEETDIARSPAQDWITLRLPVVAVEKLLDTKYSVYKHLDSGDTLVRTTSYSLPAELHDHIDVIQPTTMFGRLKSARSTLLFNDNDEDDTVALSKAKTAADNIAATLTNQVSGAVVDASCNRTITIKCLQQLYNVNYTPQNVSTTPQIGITGYLEQFANIQDLTSFYTEQQPEAVGTSFKYVSVNGGENPQNLSLSGAEAALDVQFAFGLAYPIPGVFWSTAGRPPFKPDTSTPTNTNEPYADWLDYVLSQKDADIPKSISTSYGDDEQTIPRSYAIRTCNQFAQLGVRGVSVIFSSGDWGVGDGNPDPATQECITNDGTNRTRFIPVYPASCPFVTAIGGTENIAPEVAVSRYPSGGGFSDYFPQPLYQLVDVQKYVAALPKGTYKNLYNPLGRAFPDVSTQGDRYRIWLRGIARSIGGTSASSPAFAGLIALLNDARAAKGKKSLGFLNPLIYSAKTRGVWSDVTVGKNPGCGTQGFNATKGWDPVTGLGTPNFGKLFDIVV